MKTSFPHSFIEQDLTRLDEYDAVRFFRDLMRCEMNRLKLDISTFETTEQTKAKDGGVDGIISAVPDNLNSYFLKPGLTAFQLKAGEMSPTDCQNELRIKRKPTQIKPAIKVALEQGARYVLVNFHGLAKASRDDRIEKIKEKLSDLQFPNTEVDIYSADRLVDFANKFIPLVTKWKNYLNVCLGFQSWSQQICSSNLKCFQDSQRTQLIEKIQDLLRTQNDKFREIRITGIPEIGKTRFVFEALNHDDLKHQVIYTNAKDFLGSPIHNKFKQEQSWTAILVVDDCSEPDRIRLLNELKHHKHRIVLITLSTDLSQEYIPLANHDCINDQLQPLDSKTISSIVSNNFPKLKSPAINRIAELSEGYPTFALFLAETHDKTKESSGDLLSWNSSNLVDRLIAGELDIGSDRYDRTKNVLMVLALFTSIEGKGGRVEEARWLAQSAGVHWREFCKVLHHQRALGTISKGPRISIKPIMLRLYLVRLYFEILEFDHEDFLELVNSMPQTSILKLVNSMFAQFPFMRKNNYVQALVRRLLGYGGWFNIGLLCGRGNPPLLLYLTHTNPDEGLYFLERTFDKLDANTISRQEFDLVRIRHCLNFLYTLPEYVERAVKVLMRLAVVENSVKLNSPSAVFTHQLQHVWHPDGSVKLELGKKIRLFVQLLRSKEESQRLLGLRVVQIVFNGKPFSGNFLSDEFSEQQWEGSELFDYYERIWGALTKELPSLFASDLNLPTWEAIFKLARSLSENLAFSEIMIADLSSQNYTDQDLLQLLFLIQRIVNHRSRYIRNRNEIASVVSSNIQRISTLINLFPALSQDTNKITQACFFSEFDCAYDQLSRQTPMFDSNLRDQWQRLQRISTQTLIDLHLSEISDLLTKSATYLHQQIKPIRHCIAEHQGVIESWVAFQETLRSRNFTALLLDFLATPVNAPFYDQQYLPKSVITKAQQFAQDIIGSLDEFYAHFSHVLNLSTQAITQLGRELARVDLEHEILYKALDFHVNSSRPYSPIFLAGYLEVIKATAPTVWESTLEQCFGHENTREIIYSAITRAESEDLEDLQRLFRLARDHSYPIETMQRLWFVDDVNHQLILEATRFLLSHPSSLEALPLALRIYSKHAFPDDQPANEHYPIETTEEVLFHRGLLCPQESFAYNHNPSWEWFKLYKRFKKLAPQRLLNSLDILFECLDQPFGMLKDNHTNDTRDLFFELLCEFPEQVWERIKVILEEPSHQAHHRLCSWIHSPYCYQGKRFVDCIPVELIWVWIAGDVEVRAAKFAEIIPNELLKSPKEMCWIEVVFTRYHHIARVERELQRLICGPDRFTFQEFSPTAQLKRIRSFLKADSHSEFASFLEEVATELERRAKAE